MKKLLLSLAIASAITGCGGGETLEDVKNEKNESYSLFNKSWYSVLSFLISSL